MVGYLETRTLLTLDAVAQILGSMCYVSDSKASDPTDGIVFVVDPSWGDRFALSAEDYLLGVISLVNELVNAIFSTTLSLFTSLIAVSIRR